MSHEVIVISDSEAEEGEDEDNFIVDDEGEEHDAGREQAAGRSAPLYLKCPFDDKDACKQLGGKWDAERKQWYVPAWLDPAPFRQWFISQTSKSPRQHGTHEQRDSVLYKYKHLLEEEEEEQGVEEDEEEDEDVGEEGEGDQEDGEAEGEEEEEEEVEEEEDDGKLLCVVCEARLPADDFSRKQQQEGTDLDRFCLRHTGTSAFGRSYKRARPPSTSGSEAAEEDGEGVEQ